MAAFTVTHMFLNVNKGRSCYSVVNRSRFSQFVPFTNRVREIPSKCSLQLPRIRMEAQDLAKQMKEMAAAQRRWESQVREGKVKALTPKEASYAMQLSNKVLLDVRPSTERRKAWVKDSIWIPVFDVDRKQDLETIPKKISNFVMGGWWSGIPLMVYNDKFIRQVEEKISKDANIIVACQSGIRSLAACEQLYNVGYRNLHWIRGGLDAAEEADLERSGMQPLKFAGIGGISEFLGCWKRYEPIGRLSGEEGSGFLCGLSSLEGRARARFVGRGKMPELFVQGDHSDGKADTSSCQVACKVRSNSGRVVYKIAWIWSNSGGVGQINKDMWQKRKGGVTKQYFLVVWLESFYS